MELIYKIALEVTISNSEAGLLYKYLKMHPKEQKCITEGQFAYEFRAFKDKQKFTFQINMDILDSCARVLEDQYLDDPSENILKGELLDKIYDWTTIIMGEEDAIEEFESDYYRIQVMTIKSRDFIDFSLANYLKIKHQTTSIVGEEKPKISFLNKLKRYLAR